MRRVHRCHVGQQWLGHGDITRHSLPARMHACGLGKSYVIMWLL